MSDLERLERRLERERKARKQAEEIAEAKTLEIYLARKTLEDAIDSIHEGFVLFDAEDRLQLFNARYVDLFYPGLREEVYPGRTYEEIIRVAANRGLVWEARGREEAWVADRLAEHRRAAGSRIQPWSENRWMLITERRTSEGGVVAVYTEITEVKQAEAALRESEERYALAMAGANEGMWDWNVQTADIHVSSSFVRLSGLEAPNGKVSGEQWSAAIHPKDRALREEAMQRHHDGYTEYYECEYRIGEDDADARWFLDRARSIRGENGDIKRMSGSISDISARKQSESELLEAKQRAEQAGAEVAEANRELHDISRKLAKYLSPQIYEQIFSGRQDAEISSKRKKLTIFFSDIVGFTTTTDRLESEELTTLLNHYLTEMSKIAHTFGATIDKYVGDAIIAFFGDPESQGVKEDALACVRMAIAMQRRMRELREQWQAMGSERPFELRMGINTGYCTVGNFGSDDRMAYTIIGNEVNLAARLESSADRGGILLSYETNSLVRDGIRTEPHELIDAKGFPEPIRTFRVTDIYDVDDGPSESIRHEQAGLKLVADIEAINPEEREKAVHALTQVLGRLRER